MQGLIEGYVRRVDALLPGGRNVRDDLLTELRDGLADAAAAHRRALWRRTARTTLALEC